MSENPKMTIGFILVTALAIAATANGQNGDELITGKYRLESSTNFDNYLRELGINPLFRLFANAAKPDVTIKACSAPGCEWQITTKIEGLFGRTHNMKFELDTEFADNTMDGRKVRTTIQKTSPTTMVETQRDDNGNVVTILTRVFNEKEMKVTLVANDVTAFSTFGRRN